MRLLTLVLAWSAALGTASSGEEPHAAVAALTNWLDAVVKKDQAKIEAFFTPIALLVFEETVGKESADGVVLDW